MKIFCIPDALMADNAQMYDSLQKECNARIAAEVERDALAIDASRYRWLREQGDPAGWHVQSVVVVDCGPEEPRKVISGIFTLVQQRTGSHLDAAIDAANPAPEEPAKVIP